MVVQDVRSEDEGAAVEEHHHGQIGRQVAATRIPWRIRGYQERRGKVRETIDT